MGFDDQVMLGTPSTISPSCHAGIANGSNLEVAFAFRFPGLRKRPRALTRRAASKASVFKARRFVPMFSPITRHGGVIFLLLQSPKNGGAPSEDQAQHKEAKEELENQEH